MLGDMQTYRQAVRTFNGKFHVKLHELIFHFDMPSWASWKFLCGADEL